MLIIASMPAFIVVPAFVRAALLTIAALLVIADDLIALFPRTGVMPAAVRRQQGYLGDGDPDMLVFVGRGVRDQDPYPAEGAFGLGAVPRGTAAAGPQNDERKQTRRRHAVLPQIFP
jgi:hypothetical protein